MGGRVKGALKLMQMGMGTAALISSFRTSVASSNCRTFSEQVSRQKHVAAAEPSPPKYVASNASQLAQPLKRTQRPTVSPGLAQSAYHQHRMRQQAKLLQQQQAPAEGAAAASALSVGDTPHDLVGQLMGKLESSSSAATAAGGTPPVTVLKKSGAGVVKVRGAVMRVDEGGVRCWGLVCCGFVTRSWRSS